MVEEKGRVDRICVFFSTGYPYETTLQNEFPLMASQFDHVYYFPTSISDKTGLVALPDNFEMIDTLARSRNKWSRPGMKTYLKSLKIYTQEIIKKGNFKSYLKNFKSYFSILLRNLYWAKQLEKFIEDKKLQNAFYYDYWFENATLSLAILKQKGIIHSAISRAHRFDLYDDAWGENGRVPFRDFKLKNLDSVYTVAKHGQLYFQDKVNPSLKDKVKLSYLGINIPCDKSKESARNENDSILIISVSNTRTFKRVDLIPEVLSKIDKPIKWIHFGRGPMDDIIRDRIKELPAHIDGEFRGFVPNSEIIEFYKTQNVNLLISLSTSEGLPISMMESIAFGIPIFACNVCGIPDLINESTGGMFNEADDIETITEKLNEVLERPFSVKDIKYFASQKFDYKKNYKAFYEELPYEKSR